MPRLKRVSKVVRYIVLGSIMGSAFYVFLFFYAYKGDIENFIRCISEGNMHYLVLAFILKALAVTVHGIAWFILIRVFRNVKVRDVLKITYTAVFTEFIVPIGGITEVVKVMLLTRLKLTSGDEAIASLFAHRIVLSLSIVFTTLLSLAMLSAPPVLFLALVGPALVLVGINIGGFIAPSSTKIESFINRFTSSFGTSISGFSSKYYSSIKYLIKRPNFMIAALVVELIERILNALFGFSIASIINVNIGILQSFLAFDSLYAILWLFPIVTPGGLGIFETIQTTLLTYLGINITQAATASIIARIVYVAAGYPLFAISSFLLGFSIKDVFKSNQK